MPLNAATKYKEKEFRFRASVEKSLGETVRRDCPQAAGRREPSSTRIELGAAFKNGRLSLLQWPVASGTETNQRKVRGPRRGNDVGLRAYTARPYTHHG